MSSNHPPIKEEGERNKVKGTRKKGKGWMAWIPIIAGFVRGRIRQTTTFLN